jgi:hypothetical protein
MPGQYTEDGEEQSMFHQYKIKSETLHRSWSSREYRNLKAYEECKGEGVPVHFVHNADRKLGTGLCWKCAKIKPKEIGESKKRRPRANFADEWLENWKFSIFHVFKNIGDIKPNPVLLKAGRVLLVNRYNENGTEECAEIPIVLDRTAREITCFISKLATSVSWPHQ